MTADRKKLQTENQTQMYILFLNEGANPDNIRRKIIEIGGQPFQYLAKQSVLLAQLPVQVADVLKNMSEIKHLGPVSHTTRVRKLSVKTNANGKPLWQYKVDDNNNIYMVKNKES